MNGATVRGSSVWWVVAGFLALQIPFLGTPFRVDEPNVFAIARQVAAAPLDPYGFRINWLGTEEPAWEVLRNPPLVPYWLAGWGGIFGWSERSLHGSMLVWATLALLGTGALVRRAGAPGWLGAALLGSSVAFFVSAPLLMPDVAALALSAGALALLLREDRGSAVAAIAAIAAAGAAPLAKYTAIALAAPLLLLALRTRRPAAMAAAAAPWVSLALWSGVSSALYGESHLFGSAAAQGGLKMVLAPVLVCLGLAVFSPALFALAASRRLAIVGGVTAAITFSALYFLSENGAGSALGGAAGAGLATVVLLAALERAAGERDEIRLAALAWLGAAVVLAFGYQFVTSRYLLAAAPAAAVLVARTGRRALALAGIAAGLALSLAVAVTDSIHASIYPRVAESLVASQERRVWLVGHWGFQHYGTAAGGRMLDLQDPRFEPGDRVVMSEAAFPGTRIGPLVEALGGGAVETRAIGSRWPLRTQACGASISFHGAGAASCENAYRVAIPWGFSSEPLDTIHRFGAGSPAGGGRERR